MNIHLICDRCNRTFVTQLLEGHCPNCQRVHCNTLWPRATTAKELRSAYATLRYLPAIYLPAASTAN